MNCDVIEQSLISWNPNGAWELLRGGTAAAHLNNPHQTQSNSNQSCHSSQPSSLHYMVLLLPFISGHAEWIYLLLHGHSYSIQNIKCHIPISFRFLPCFQKQALKSTKEREWSQWRTEHMIIRADNTKSKTVLSSHWTEAVTDKLQLSGYGNHSFLHSVKQPHPHPTSKKQADGIKRLWPLCFF